MKKSNVDTETPSAIKHTSNSQNYQDQQMLYEQQKRKLHEQKKLQEQAAQQQHQMFPSPFQNLNNIKPSTGLTPGTVYAKPDKHYHPSRGSNVE